MRVFTTLAVILLLQACKHPLAIVGEGDIVDANNSGHGCTHEQFQAQDTACSENEVSGNYFVNYKAERFFDSRTVPGLAHKLLLYFSVFTLP